VKYQYRAVEKFWRNFYALRSEQKESVRRAWHIFKRDPFHPSLGAHEIRELSARAKHTVYSAVIEADLRVIFRVDGGWVTSLDVGTHSIYRR
jgi:Txe/YoeB family toxin of Txe-Axe toxin-antitoxin module